jgi:hypothetical protein
MRGDVKGIRGLQGSVGALQQGACGVAGGATAGPYMRAVWGARAVS